MLSFSVDFILPIKTSHIWNYVGAYVKADDSSKLIETNLIQQIL